MNKVGKKVWFFVENPIKTIHIPIFRLICGEEERFFPG